MFPCFTAVSPPTLWPDILNVASCYKHSWNRCKIVGKNQASLNYRFLNKTIFVEENWAVGSRLFYLALLLPNQNCVNLKWIILIQAEARGKFFCHFTKVRCNNKYSWKWNTQKQSLLCKHWRLCYMSKSTFFSNLAFCLFSNLICASQVFVVVHCLF